MSSCLRSRSLLIAFAITTFSCGGSDPEELPDAGARPPDAGELNNPDASATTCALPIEGELQLPTDRKVATLRGTSENLTTSCTPQQGTQGPEHFYRLVVTDRTGARLTVNASTDTVLAIRRACDDPVSEIVCNNDQGPTSKNPEVRTVLEPGEYFVLVDVAAFGIGGDYVLTLTTFDPPPNALCSNATPVVAGQMITGDLSSGALIPLPMCPTAPEVPAALVLYYQLTVPPKSRAVVNAVPNAGTPPVELRVLDGCAATACATGGGPAFVAVNTESDPLDLLFVAASPLKEGPAPNFTLTTSVDALADNASCLDATPLTAGSTLSGDTTLGGSTPLMCDGPPPIGFPAALYYSMTVPAGALLGVEVTPLSALTPWVASVALTDGCNTTTCLAQPQGAPGATAATYVNTGATARDVIVAVGPVDGQSGGPFNLVADVVPPPTNLTCASATALGTTVSLPFELPSGSVTATTACVPNAVGGVVYYSAHVPSQERLTLEVRARGAWEPVIRLLPSCAARSCITSSGSAGFGTATLTWTNSSSAAADVIVAVGALTTAMGTFALSARTGPVPYLETPIAVACEDLSNRPALPGVTSDDSVSPVSPLPFALAFMGQSMTHFAVSSNGLLELFTSSSGMPSQEFLNAPIPSPLPPSGYIAPFWDDLLPGTVRTATTTGTNAHFTVEWAGFQSFSDRGASLRFQAKVFPAGVVELHYCSLRPGPMPGPVTGESATIGLESADGLDGAVHSFNAPGAVTSSTAIRFTPN